MKIGFVSDVGQERASNEDSVVIVRNDAIYESQKAQTTVLAVADGVGGHNAGEVASRLVAGRVAGEMTRTLLPERVGLSSTKINAILQEVIKKVNRNLFNYAKENPRYKGMGTTITAYIVNRDEIVQITKDHSLVQEMVDRGEITKEEARIHPQKHVITKAVGTSSHIYVDTFTKTIYGDDYLLLCSDGLTNEVSDEEIHRTVIEFGDPQKICDALIRKAHNRNSFTSISVIIAQSDDLPIKKRDCCPGCSRKIEPDWKACPYCKADLELNVCPSCGYAVSPIAVRCPNCGISFKEETEVY